MKEGWRRNGLLNGPESGRGEAETGAGVGVGAVDDDDGWVMTRGM